MTTGLELWGPGSAYGLLFGSGGVLWGNGIRYYGFTVRAVRVSQN